MAGSVRENQRCRIDLFPLCQNRLISDAQMLLYRYFSLVEVTIRIDQHSGTFKRRSSRETSMGFSISLTSAHIYDSLPIAKCRLFQMSQRINCSRKYLGKDVTILDVVQSGNFNRIVPCRSKAVYPNEKCVNSHVSACCSRKTGWTTIQINSYAIFEREQLDSRFLTGNSIFFIRIT